MTDDDVITSEDQESIALIPPSCKTLYSEIHLFVETRKILLFNKRDYRVAIPVGPISNKMHPVSFVFDICAGPNLIRENLREAK